MGRSQGPRSAGRALAAGSAQQRPGKALFLSRGRRPPRSEQSGRTEGIPAPVPAQASCAASEAAGNHDGGHDADRKYSTENLSFSPGLETEHGACPETGGENVLLGGMAKEARTCRCIFLSSFLFQSSWSLVT